MIPPVRPQRGLPSIAAASEGPADRMAAVTSTLTGSPHRYWWGTLSVCMFHVTGHSGGTTHPRLLRGDAFSVSSVASDQRSSAASYACNTYICTVEYHPQQINAPPQVEKSI